MVVFACVAVLAVLDGDTFTVALDKVGAPFSPISVRVAGIDAPELHAKRKCEREAAEKAKANLQKLLQAPCITLSDVRRDKYFRLLANVSSPDNISALQISGGFAVAYQGDKKAPWKCAAAKNNQ